MHPMTISVRKKDFRRTLLEKVKNILGPTHSDDLAYLFNLQYCKSKDEPAPAKNSKDREVLECYTTMWVNFAKTG